MTGSLANPALTAVDYGLDMRFAVGTIVTDRVSTGARLVGEAAVIRLSTERGSAIDSPDDGLDLSSLIHEDVSDRDVLGIPNLVRREVMRDERVLGAIVTQEWDSDASTLSLAIVLYTAAGPFRLVLSVSAAADAIEVLDFSALGGG